MLSLGLIDSDARRIDFHVLSFTFNNNVKPSERLHTHSTWEAVSLRKNLLQSGIKIRIRIHSRSKFNQNPSTWRLGFGAPLRWKAVVAAPLLLVLHLQQLDKALVTVVSTLVFVVEDPCQADEICTRILDSKVRGMEGDAGTDLGLKVCSSWCVVLPNLGDSISGTCRKLELFFAWTEGE